MKKRILIILVIIILIVISLFFMYPKFTGKTISEVDSGRYLCSDSDGGINYSVQGTVKQGDVVKATDYCTSDIRLKEHYCLSSTTVNHKYYECSYKCSEGACIEEPDEEIEEEIEEDTSKDVIEQIEDENATDVLKKMINWFKRLFKRF